MAAGERPTSAHYKWYVVAMLWGISFFWGRLVAALQRSILYRKVIIQTSESTVLALK